MAPGGRDRDASGRARSARPRDGAGRPLPYGSPGVAGVPDHVLPPAEALAEAERLLVAGYPFQAHEVLEGAWKVAPESESGLWQGLAQLAVGLTHLQRGNAVGAVTLLRRGAARLGPFASSPPHDVPVEDVRAWADAAAGAIEASDTQATLPPRPTLRPNERAL